MSRARLLPHIGVALDAVTWGPWWIELDGTRSLADDRLRGWDYASEISFEVQPTIDVRRATRSCGIADSGSLAVLALLDCRSTGLRLAQKLSLAAVEAGQSNLLRLAPRPGQVADLVELSVHLVFTGSGAPNDEGRAWRAGSRMASSTVTRVRLEGADPRFPTESVSFKNLGLEQAAWTVQLHFTDLDESFMGGVRLLLNSDHPSASRILDPQGPEGVVLTSCLRIDVVRQMLVHLATDDGLDLTRGNWQDGSVGAVVASLAESAFSMDLPSIIRLIQNDYLRFERRLQAGFDFLSGVGK